MSFSIQALPFSELERVRPLYEQLIANNAATSTYFGAEFQTFTFEGRRMRLQRKLREGLQIELFVLTEDDTGRDVGYAVISYDPELRDGELEMICTLPEYRGQGLGGQLMQHLLDRFKALGIEELSIAVAYGNEGALRFYRRYGFDPFVVVLANHLG